MRFFRFQFLRLSPRTQRRLQRWAGLVMTWVAYPFRLVGGLFAQLWRLLIQWWDQRNLRYLIQGLPSVAVFIGLIVFGAMVFFQDRGVLANSYQMQAQRSMGEAEQQLRANKECGPQLAMAQMCYK